MSVVNNNVYDHNVMLIEQLMDQAEMDYFIQEALLISEGENSISNIEVIREGFIDKIKDGITKFFGFIKKMWGKFLEAMSTLINTDKAYLEKYKDIILKKKPKDYDYEMYDYTGSGGLQRLLNSSIPDFDINDKTLQGDKDDDTDEFVKAHFAFLLNGGAKPPYNVRELAYTSFRGGTSEKTINAKQLNMTDIYNYCHDYIKLKDAIAKDVKAVETSCVKVLDEIDKAARNNDIKRESVNIFESDQYYSTVYNTFVNELFNRKPKNNPGAATPQSQASSGGTAAQPSNNTGAATPQASSGNNNDGDKVEGKNPGGDRVEPNNNNNANPNDKNSDIYKQNSSNNPNSNDFNAKDAAQENDTAKDLSRRARKYFRVCGDFIGAKQTIAEEIYKTYMKIIKAHVRDYVGTDKAADTKGKDVASDMTNTKTEEPKQTNNAAAVKDAGDKAQADGQNKK